MDTMLLNGLARQTINQNLIKIGADWFLDGAGDLARALGITAFEM